ncbi:MAG: hypothetical protein JXA03_12280 [Bacteroidales bacterium]|nr:hypothetical protein [Bacteroidales bacterium]
MKGPKDQYTREMHKKFGYYATWEPNRPLSLGDVGIFRKNEFTRISNLVHFNISFNINPDDTPGDLEYNSQGNVTITTKLSGTIPAAGSVLTEADAGISVDFARESSILFKANKTLTPSIDDLVALGKKIIELFKQGKWNKDWVVITELVKADTATILISNKGGSKIELKATANVSASDFDIADAAFEFAPAFSKGLETKIIAEKGITPLFKVMGIKSRLFMPPVFTSKSVRAVDLLTPAEAKGKMRDKIYFGNVDFEEDEDG